MAKRLTSNKQMSHAIYQLNKSSREKYRKRFRVTLAITMASLIILAILSIIAIRTLANINKQGSESAVGNKITSKIAGPKLFKNQYFEFYSSDDWRLDTSDTKANKTMYILYSNGVVAGSFEVFVNQTPIPDQLGATMALPVAISGNTFSHVGVISKPCGQTYAPTALKRIGEVSISSTSMLCIPDSSQYIVILGKVGADYNLKMLRANGQIANYIIIYRSSSYTPSAASFMNLIPSFKSL